MRSKSAFPSVLFVVIVPSSAVESMQLGGLAGLTALTMGLENAKNGAAKRVVVENGAETTVDRSHS